MSRSFSLTFTHKMTVTLENGSRPLGFVSRCDLEGGGDENLLWILDVGETRRLGR